MKENVSERNAPRNSVPDAKKIVTQEGREIARCLHPPEKALASPNGAETFGENMQSSPGCRALLHRCGAVILFLGICLAAFIYWSAPPATGSQAVYEDSPLAPEDSRRYAHDTEVNFGKAGVLGDKARRMAGQLGKPKPLAVTVIVVSGLLASGCFLFSRADVAGD